MKGLVFTEFFEMVEANYGLAMIEDLIEATQPSSGGCYTSVSSYNHQELIDMVVELADRTNSQVNDLVYAFGRHLAKVFSSKFTSFFDECPDTLSFLKRIDDHIHVEVHKLYPDAELPEFSFDDSDPDCFQLTYKSVRNFSDLALGLIEGCAEHYNEQFDITREDIDDSNNGADKTQVRFLIRPHA